MPETVALLEQVPLLRGLSDAELARLARAVRKVTFDAGDDIVRIGEPGHSLYLVLEGSVRVIYPGRSTDLELAQLGAGDFFGEMALLNDKPRSATVRALEPVVALALDKAAFRAAAREAPTLALHAMQALSERIRSTDEQLGVLVDEALSDPLTGLLNRRAFRERLTREVARVQRYEAPLALVRLDVDELEPLTDTLGPDAGEAILRWMGRMLLEHTRAADCPFRLGDGSFAVLCPHTEPGGARQAAQRLVGLVSGARPPVDGLTLSLAAGYATAPEHGRTSDEVYLASDLALDEARKRGPNHVGDPAGQAPR